MNKFHESFIKTVIKEQDSTREKLEIRVRVDTGVEGVELTPEGYESPNGGGPVLLEVWGGKLRLVVWSDKEKEEPTHIIPLEGAKILKN